MNTDKIRRALESAAARIGCPPGDNSDADIYRDIMEAIAELDKAKAMTDEPVAWMWTQLMHGYMRGWHFKCETFSPLNSIHVNPDDIKDLKPLYLAPSAGNGLSAEEVMGIVEPMCLGDASARTIRARLEAAIKAKQP